MNTTVEKETASPEPKVSPGGDSLGRIVRLSDIDPKINAAFSPNLFRWLRKHRIMQMFADRYEHDGTEYIGFLDDGGSFVGSKLWGVLCNGGRERTWSFSWIGRDAVLRPMWADYLKRGRCALDPEHDQHFLGERFSQNGNTRTCLWCGCLQRRETYTVTKTCVRWVSSPNAKLRDAGESGVEQH
jgi:hypothetical protein